jgi:large subunit ribosomal protein L10
MPNKKVLEEKQAKIAALSASMKDYKSIVLVDHRGLTVEEDTQLRTELRKAGVQYSVIKNTIIRFAAKENGMDDLVPYLEGPTALAIGKADEITAAKVLNEFAKKHPKLELKAGLVEGRVMDVKGVQALAELPPKNVLIARALGGFKAPINGLVNVLNGNIRGLVVALNAIKEQKATA